MRPNNGVFWLACIVLAALAEEMMLRRSLRRWLWKVPVILCLWLMPAIAHGAEKTPPMRTWSSADGKFHVLARLAEAQAEAVVLEREDGSRITVPRAKLSDVDLNYVDWQTAPAAADDDRAKPAPTTPKEMEGPAAANTKADSPKIGEPFPKDPPGPDAAAGAPGKETRLSLKDIEQLRQRGTAAEQVVDDVAEQGRAFEVTAETAEQLRTLGFRPAQIDAIKESSAEPLVPGRWLTTSDAQRNEISAQMKVVALKSKADIQPVESQHVTLWAAREIQQTYLPDVQKLEKFFHTRCGEPIRSGLDKRSTHVVLLKNHAEYEAWCGTLFDLFGKQFEVKDNPGAFEEARSLILKQSVFNWWHVCAISVGEQRLEHAHRDLAASVGRMYFLQLVWRRDDGPLLTGFADGAEAVVSGSPSIMYSSVGYHEELRKIEANPRPWILQVQGRMAADRATPPGKLLEMNTHNMLQPHFAEAWTLVGLLSRQPAKFGRLLMAMRTGVPELQAIEKIYDWDEKKLTAEWRAYVMGQGNKK